MAHHHQKRNDYKTEASSGKTFHSCAIATVVTGAAALAGPRFVLSVSTVTSFSQRLMTTVATPLPMRLVSARHSLMNRSMPTSSASDSIGTLGTAVRVA